MSQIVKAGEGTALVSDLRTLTPARISLARTGNSITTRDTLAFALDHAQARDAVQASLSVPTLMRELQSRGHSVFAVKSAAADRMSYLKRPDLGRRLSEVSLASLRSKLPPTSFPRLAIILADGLSALAVDRHALAVVDVLLPLVQNELETTPIVIAEQARVALGDEIGAALGAAVTVMLIGERPGLSAADSLGAYITWEPRSGRTNAERNCVSNIRNEGLVPAVAAQRIAYFLREAQRLQMTGTRLKDPDGQALLQVPHEAAL